MNTTTIQADQFLVCGLGSLGQHCVRALKRFGVKVTAVDLAEPSYWDLDGIPDMLEDLVTGDCRQDRVLEKADIRRQRAILLVTSDERTNIEAAFVARLKNPEIRLVIRSGQRNLNDLLEQQLGNLAALEPTELSAPAFALAALGEQTAGCFYLENQLLKVLKYRIEPGDPLLGWSLEQLNNRSHRILTHCRQGEEPPQGFHQYRPDTIIEVGDILSYIEVTGRWAGIIPDSTTAKNGQAPLRLPPQSNVNESRERLGLFKKAYGFFRDSARRHFWRNPIFKITAVCLAAVLILLSIGSGLFYLFGDGLNFSDSIYATVVLLLGGYPDLLGSDLRFNLPIPWWLRLLGLFFTLAGTFILGALYAVITGNILAARFQFVRRSRPPERDHVVLIGLGRVGRKVALLLNEFRQPLAALAQDEQEANLPQSLPVVFGNGDATQAFARTNLSTCKSVVALTEDEMTNLEICLNSRKINPACNLVLGTFHQRFNDHVARLFPYARALCASALAAEAFAAAAFGENVPSLFYQNDQTVLVTQYFIQSDDTLHGKLLADIAYGYGVLPIVLTKGATGQAIWMPSNDLRLNLGDHLTVLATSEGLRRVEKGEITPPDHQVTLEPASPSVRVQAAGIIGRITGADKRTALKYLEKDREAATIPLHSHQGYRLVASLKDLGVEASLAPLSAPE